MCIGIGESTQLQYVKVCGSNNNNFWFFLHLKKKQLQMIVWELQL